MSRLAEMDEYDSMFGRRLVDEDFLAAGFTPQEVQQYRGLIVQPSLTPQDISAMEAQYGTLEAPDPTLRQRGAARVQDRLIRAGLDPYVAGSYSRRILGDTAPTDGGLGIGLADLTPLGMVFGTQEGARTAVQGYQQGDPVQMGLGALEVGLGALEATPLTAAIGRGIAATARQMDPNTLYSVFGPPSARSTGGEATGIRAYHGSPHDFDRFDMSKIGTGEGAQAYGHGLYFAESEDVARNYRSALSQGMGDGNLRSIGVGDSDLRAMRQFTQSAVDPDTALRDWLHWIGKKETPELRDAFMRDWSGRNDGRLYEVNINANPEDFLDWDRPLSEQPQKVRDALRGTNYKLPGSSFTSGELAETIDALTPEQRAYMLKQAGLNPTGSEIARSAGQDVSALREAGIPGIRYLDAGSRGAGDGSRNYVVFDENLIEIVRKYGIAGAAAMLGVSSLDVEQAIAQNLPPSEWDRVLVGPQ